MDPVKPKLKPVLVRLGQNESPGLPGRAGQPTHSQGQHCDDSQGTHTGAAYGKPNKGKNFVSSLKVTKNTKKKPEGGGGEGEEVK